MTINVKRAAQNRAADLAVVPVEAARVLVALAHMARAEALRARAEQMSGHVANAASAAPRGGKPGQRVRRTSRQRRP